MKISKYKVLLLGALLAVTVTGWGMSNGKFGFFKPKPVIKATAAKLKAPVAKVLDTALVRQLGNALNNFNPNRSSYTITGSIDVTDKSDSSKNTLNMDFVLCKKDSAFYYRIGKIETINESGINLNIDNAGRKIFRTNEKKLLGFNMLTAAQLYDILKTQNFDVSASVQGAVKTIRLLNENNIACKEYAISFDTVSNTISRIYTRQPSSSEPLNTKKDRATDLKILKVENKASLSDYTRVGDVFDTQGNLRGDYKTYRIINL